MKKAIVFATTILAISSISIPTYAVTGGISVEAVERSQGKGFSGKGKNPWKRLDADNTETTLTKYSSGQYKVGTDIPSGEYILFASGGNGYFCLSSDGNESDIIVNDNFEYDSILTINDGEYLNLSRCYAVSITENPTVETTQTGMFLVGKHIPAGEYKLDAGSDSGYYCIEDVEIDGEMRRCLCATGYINESRYPNFVKWLEKQLESGSPVYGSVEFSGTKDNDGEIIYEDGWKEQGRVPMIYDYIGHSLISIAPADDAALVTAFDMARGEFDDKNIIEKLKDDERFVEIVQETLNERTSKEILKDAQQWKQLLKETQGLRQNYENLIAEMKLMREEVIRATWGNKFRHKLARLLLR